MLRKMRGGLPQKKTRAIQKIIAAETGRRENQKNQKNPIPSSQELRRKLRKRRKRSAGKMKTARM